MSLSEYSFLWDGTEPGWTIHVMWRNEHDVCVVFGEAGPSVAELAKLRQLVDAYRALSAREAHTRFASKPRVTVGRKSAIEAHQLAHRAKALGLTVELEGHCTTSHLPVNELTNVALIIEDDDEAERVCKEAIARGVKVVETEVC